MGHEMREQKLEMLLHVFGWHRIEQVSLDHRITTIRRHAVRNPKPNDSHPTQGNAHTTHTPAKRCIDAKQNIESVKQTVAIGG